MAVNKQYITRQSTTHTGILFLPSPMLQVVLEL